MTRPPASEADTSMTQASAGPVPTARWHAAAVIAVLALGCMLTLAAAWLQQRANEQRVGEELQAATRKVATVVMQRMGRMELGLLSARGAMLASGWDSVSRQAYLRYSRSRDVDREFPGARGFGVIRRVPVEREAAFVAAAAADDWPGFKVRALSPHDDERFVIQYIEPVQRNREAVGLDIGSEANRRQAAWQALRRGSVTLTAPITLVQATGKPRAGFLILLPVYREDLPPDADAEVRVAAGLGWTYAPLVIHEVLASMDIDTEGYTLQIADIDGASVRPFYASADDLPPVAHVPAMVIDQPVFGRTWRIELRARPAFVARHAALDPRSVGLTGVVISVLLSFAVHAWLRSRRQSRELLAERERRAAALQTSRDAIVMVDLNGGIFDWNQGAERLFGHAPAEVLGRNFVDLLVPPEAFGEVDRAMAGARQGEIPPPLDTERLHRDGSRVAVSTSMVPLRGPRGEFAGFSVSMRDIRAAREAARQIEELNTSLERKVQQRTQEVDAALTDLRNTLDAVPAMVAYWDADQRWVRGNRAWQAALGQPDPAGVSMGAAAAFATRAPEIVEHLSAVQRGSRETFECRIECVQGGSRDVLVDLLPDVRAGRVAGFYSVLQDIRQQKLVQSRLAAALRESEAFLHTLHTHAIVSVTDRRGTIVDANDSFCRISRYSRDELIGHNHRIINSGTHPAAFWSAMWRTIASGRSWRGEVCNRAKDGSLYWVDSIIAPVTGADGEVERYYSIRFDITATKLGRQRLQASERQLARTGELAQVGGWQWDLDATAVDLSPQARRILDLGADEAVSMDRLVGLCEAPARDSLQLAVDGARAGGQGWDLELPLITAHGRAIWVRSVAEREVAAGHVPRLVGGIQDITQRMAATREVQELARTLQAVLDASSEVAIIATDSKGRVEVFNRGAERLLGYSSAEAAGKRAHVLFHDPDEVRTRQEELATLRGGPAEAAEVLTDPSWLGRAREWTFVHRDGHRVPVSMILGQMRDAEGSVIGYVGVAVDVTQRRADERELREATARAESASKAKSEFLASMSHEIRSPMNAVLGLAYLLSQSPLDVEQRSLLDRITLASQGLLQIINDILDISKIEAGELSLVREAFAPAALVCNAVAMASVLAQDKPVDVHSHIADTLPERLQGDSVRLNQVLTNLLSNAVKFTARGRVTLDADWLPDGQRGGHLLLKVSDTGIGMDADALQRIFQPFVQAEAGTTRRFGGTGLGLSIVKRLVALMGGHIEVSSQPGAGSEFRVDIPFAEAAADSDAGVPELALPDDVLAGQTILVVDDTDINRDVARRILERRGARVRIAVDGEQAVGRIAAVDHGIDAVLMDVHMPVMDGAEATHRIRQLPGGQGLPIIALTAGATTSERDCALAAGMDDFVTKPFDPTALVRLIARRLHIRTIEPAAASREPPPPAWPVIEGIDTDWSRSLMSDDLRLFRKLLSSFIEHWPSLGLPADLASERGRTVAIQKAHQLRGIAGTLAMREVHVLAGEIEDRLRSGDVDGARSRTGAVDGLLQQLQASLRGALDADAPAGPAAAAAAELPREQLDELLQLLRRNSMKATERFEQLSTVLQGRLGDNRYQQLAELVDQLRLPAALELLEDALT